MVRRIKINEAFGDKMLKNLREFLEDELTERFEDNLAQKASGKVNSYNPSWVADQESNDLKKAREAYIDAVIVDLISNG